MLQLRVAFAMKPRLKGRQTVLTNLSEWHRMLQAGKMPVLEMDDLKERHEASQTSEPASFSPNLRVAVFSGNYNYVRDGANMTLNRLVAYLERQGIAVRVYSPTTDTPAFEPAGTLISVPSVPVPRRREYRIALGMPRAIREDLIRFRPTLVHLSAPDLLGRAALKQARRMGIPAVASFHTRFDTYLKYYGLDWLQPVLLRYLRSFYRQCVQTYAPSTCTADSIQAEGLTDNIRIWSRGVDRRQYHPGRRDWGWRQSLGIAPDEAVLVFVGRLVLEKGLDVLADLSDALTRRGLPHKVLIVGDGPERQPMQQRLPNAIFTGFLSGDDLARAYASADIFINPSTTEAFGNVTLEAMASGLPCLCADATGSRSLVVPGENGYLVSPTSIEEYANRAAALITDPNLRRHMGATGRKLSARYDWDAVMESLVGHYREVLAQHFATSAQNTRHAGAPVQISG